MRRLVLACVAVAVLTPGVAVYAVSAAGAPAADGTLFAAVGPGAEISLVDAAGAPVSNLEPGTYEIQIDDRSDLHNFHLIGPGSVNAGTEIAFVGIRTVTVTLVNGQYTFVCDDHAYDMIGQFLVGSGTGSTPPATPTPTLPRLVATVGPGFKINLTRGGRKVTRLKARRYTIVVRDRSSMHNFKLTGPGIRKSTTVTFVGTRTWTLRLRPGLHRYVCTPHATVMRGSFRVVR